VVVSDVVVVVVVVVVIVIVIIKNKLITVTLAVTFNKELIGF